MGYGQVMGSDLELGFDRKHDDAHEKAPDTGGFFL